MTLTKTAGSNYNLTTYQEADRQVEILPLSPDQMARILSFEVKDSLRITFQIQADGNHNFIVLGNDTKTNTSWFQNWDESTIGFSGWTGKKITKQLMANRLALYEVSNCPSVTSKFGFVGAYAFARYGFIPEQGDWDALRKKINTVLDSACDICNTPLGTDGRIRDILKSEDPKSLWTLIDEPLRGRNNYESFAYYLLSKAGLNWNGKFDLKNEEQMERARNYIGREIFDASFDNARQIAQEDKNLKQQPSGTPLYALRPPGGNA